MPAKNPYLGYVRFSGFYLGKGYACSKCVSCEKFEKSEDLSRKFRCNTQTLDYRSAAGYCADHEDAPPDSCQEYTAAGSPKSAGKPLPVFGGGMSPGKKVLSGLGDIGGQLGGKGSLDGGAILGGAGKVAVGLGGLAVGAVKGAASLANNLSEEGESGGGLLGAVMGGSNERAAEPKEDSRKHEAALNKISTVAFGNDVSSVTQALSELLPYLSFTVGDHGLSQSIQNAACDKIEFGILQLRNKGETANADFFQKKLDESDYIKEKQSKAEKKEKTDALKNQFLGALGMGGDKKSPFGGLGGLFGKKK